MPIWYLHDESRCLAFVIFANDIHAAKAKAIDRYRKIQPNDDLKPEELTIEPFTPEDYDGVLCFY